jgi:hypothetical protein
MKPVFLVLGCGVLGCLTVTARTAWAQGRPGGVAAVSSADSPLRAAIEKIDEMPQSPERTLEEKRFAAAGSFDDMAAYLADFEGDPPSRVTQVLSNEIFRQNPTFAREAVIHQLDSRGSCRFGLYFAAEQVWDTRGRVEKAIIAKIDTGGDDTLFALRALEHKGGRGAVSAVAKALFESNVPTATWSAQLALQAIGRRDPNPDEALAPFLDQLSVGTPGNGDSERNRKRDVILACAASTGRAIPYLRGTLAKLNTNDFDYRGNCWESLCRIGTMDAVSIVLDAFTDERQCLNEWPGPDWEERRKLIIAGYLNQALKIAADPVFLRRVAGIVQNEKGDVRNEIFKSLEGITNQRFDGDVQKINAYADLTEKNQNTPTTPVDPGK